MSGDYDILIVGGGMVGASLARSLNGLNLRVGVVEPVAPSDKVQPSYDDRVIALSWGSRVILDAIGCWDAIAPEAEPIRKVHISDRGHFGAARLDHQEEGVPALGYVVSARAIGQSLLDGIDRQASLDWLCPAKLTGFHVDEAGVSASLSMDGEHRDVRTRLLVAADGGNSPIRKQLDLPMQEWQYGHTAVIANVSAGFAHNGVAYERFTDTGPLAMLPMTEGRCSLVWTQRDEAVPDVMGWDDATFLARLQECFGTRLGRLEKVGERAAYPLCLLRVKEMVRERVAVIGNAAHTLHPVTGQGLNLGLRDVAGLADELAKAATMGTDPGADVVLKRYADARSGDQGRVALITDVLARMFASPLPPVRLARNLGLVALDLAPTVKHGVSRQFMGVRGSLPRLSRGLPLD